jgi:hypothetical protein
MGKGHYSILLHGVSTPSRKGVIWFITQDTPPQHSSTTFDHNPASGHMRELARRQKSALLKQHDVRDAWITERY